MYRRLIKEGFNRRYVLLPLLLSIALVLLGYWITASRRAESRQLIELVAERQEVIRLLTDISYSAMQAESAQRGFVLTGEEKYLAPFESELAAAAQKLAELRDRYGRLNPAQLPALGGIDRDLAVKSQEMRQSIALQKQGKAQEALALVRSDLGLYKMSAISQALETLRGQERGNVLAGLEEWRRATRMNTILNICNLVFTIVLLLVLGLLATRDIRRRSMFAAQLAARVEERTAELRDLSRHMSRIAETEKHALARELHDELGGLLVAMRMDISQLRKRCPPGDGDTARWERVEHALSQGMELKRRVIEDLRPTLLDNMGLFTALRWLATQHAEQAQLTLRMQGLDEDVDIAPETAIAVFRTVQEAIANVIRHAEATTLEVKAAVGERLELEIADDGCGLPAGADRQPGAHGLKQMHFRIEAVGGELQLRTRQPHGTSVMLTVPLAQPAG
ncbi:MAG TPA: CHASE3 domain-containing protein [Steroidobacteraceae bacterium]|nr:CHASE3 domain-containing protein [Steroidobacteraceae bacterium]